MWGHRDQQALKALKVRRVQQVLKEWQDHKALRVQLGQLAHKAQQVWTERKV
jgi:hypothetical protein